MQLANKIKAGGFPNSGGFVVAAAVVVGQALDPVRPVQIPLMPGREAVVLDGRSFSLRDHQRRKGQCQECQNEENFFHKFLPAQCAVAITDDAVLDFVTSARQNCIPHLVIPEL